MRTEERGTHLDTVDPDAARDSVHSKMQARSRAYVPKRYTQRCMTGVKWFAAGDSVGRSVCRLAMTPFYPYVESLTALFLADERVLRAHWPAVDVSAEVYLRSWMVARL